MLLWELGMVHQIRVYHILQIASPVVRQQYVHRFGAGVGLVGSDAVVDTVDDVWAILKQRVCFYFFQRLRYGFLAKRAADLLQGVEGLRAGVLDEVDIGEAALCCAVTLTTKRLPTHERRRCLTSPNRRRILKLRLLILSDGDPGKQTRQLPKE